MYCSWGGNLITGVMRADCLITGINSGLHSLCTFMGKFSLLSVVWLWQRATQAGQHHTDSTVVSLRGNRCRPADYTCIPVSWYLSLATSLIDRFSTHVLCSSWQRMFDDGCLENKWEDQFFGFGTSFFFSGQVRLKACPRLKILYKWSLSTVATITPPVQAVSR